MEKDINLSEFDKMRSGLAYDPLDADLLCRRKRAFNLTERFNVLSPFGSKEREQVASELFASIGVETCIMPRFSCDYGENIYLGSRCYINYNCVMLDCASISLGDGVLIGPNCGLYTAIHPLNSGLRLQGIEMAKPIKVGDGVWLGGNVTILPGVSIGEYSVIGAGSVVTKDIPSRVLAYGNPCRVIKELG
ncbi:MAG: sugar O-acetyltransferase [Candidatus Bruticola sp.]